MQLDICLEFSTTWKAHVGAEKHAHGEAILRDEKIPIGCDRFEDCIVGTRALRGICQLAAM